MKILKKKKKKNFFFLFVVGKPHFALSPIYGKISEPMAIILSKSPPSLIPEYFIFQSILHHSIEFLASWIWETLSSNRLVYYRLCSQFYYVNSPTLLPQIMIYIY